MRSLLIRIFVAFWSIIVITIVIAAVLGYTYAERARATVQNFEVSEAMLEASAALRDGGREGLTEWLQSVPGPAVALIYVVDDRGRDLLDRRLPRPVSIAVRRFGEPRSRRSGPPHEFGNLRPARPFTQLVGPDDHVYTFFVLPPQGKLGRWLTERGAVGVAILALLVSGAISYLLARAISEPIRRFRESAVAIAAGNLDTRVTDRVGRRRDEIGLLAQDFDRMANELQRAWQRQTELTRNVSHELRSPLARLRVALELVRRKSGDLPELDRIETETGRLDDLIGQILEFSRLDADPHEQRASVDLDELIQSIVEDVRYEHGRGGREGGIAFESDRGERHPAFRGYPNALRSGLENVLRNAMQHGSEDGVVRVRLRDDGSKVAITIADNGGGVPEDQLDRIFEPFYRADTQSQRSRPGTGLGLAIAARAIAMNGGSLTASNTANGLRVEIRLPLEE